MVSNINVCRYSPYFIFNKSVGRNVSITVKPLCFYVSGKYNSWIICRKSFDYIMRPRENTKQLATIQQIKHNIFRKTVCQEKG